RQDVGELAVGIFHQRDEGGAVRIVFQPLDRADDVELAPLEIDQAVGPLVAAAAEARRHAAEIVAAALRRKAFREALHRLALVEAGAVDNDQLALARRDRLVALECHLLLPQRPVAMSIEWPSASVT